VGRDNRILIIDIKVPRFNPRARVGRDPLEMSRTSISQSFNPRARVGRDNSTRAYCLKSAFQSTRPRGARQHRCSRRLRQAQFQSTRPRGARPRCGYLLSSSGAFQSTRPRGARLNREGRFFDSLRVSIHAPAWGATWLLKIQPPEGQVSIHAPAWGATFKSGKMRLFITFQSTRPRGARRGAAGCDSRVSACFNPRARVGRDQFRRQRPNSVACFNPRARVGRD